jgi:hypothetical protein
MNGMRRASSPSFTECVEAADERRHRFVVR